MLEGTGARGRQRMKFMDGVKVVVGCGRIADVIRMAEDSPRWRYIIANVNIQDTARRFTKTSNRNIGIKRLHLLLEVTSVMC